ncbi:MAG: polysaccharide ABC transporter ATP-binding protein [Bacteroidaceae bacterium]|nr:polysaccharide ABC transporter ATP-binding protein [Bacteroidaceae bacterium]
MLDKNIAIEFNNVGKQYRLGLVGTGTLKHDLNRWWQTTILGKEDPYLKIGEVNDRSTKGNSDYVWALKDISFKIEQGDVVGIIGKNGAGKSTLLKLLSHITAPSTGTIAYRGRIASLLEVGTGFHPEMTARQNIYMNSSIMGMTKHEIDIKLDEIVDFAGIERYLDTPVKRFSSGMTVRLGFAVAAFLEPEILVVDEVLAVGDAEFQKKAIGKMKDVSSSGGRTVLFVSHNMTAVKQLCKSGIILENGQISYSGTSENAIEKYFAFDPNEMAKPFCKRTDRYGNGKIRVNNIILRNINGKEMTEAFVGQYLRIEFHIDVEEGIDLSNMVVICAFLDMFGRSSVTWGSDEIAHDFGGIKDGVFSLVIPSLTLRPNTYNLKFVISLNTTKLKDLCDAMNGALQLTILNDDFFSKGINLHANRGYSAIMPANFE